MSNQKNKNLTITEAAKYIGVSDRTIREWHCREAKSHRRQERPAHFLKVQPGKSCGKRGSRRETPHVS